MGLVAAFVLGAVAFWAVLLLARQLAFGGRRVGSEARQRWLARMDYEGLLRAREQIDGEIKKRQPS